MNDAIRLAHIQEEYKGGPYLDFEAIRNSGSREERLARMLGRNSIGISDTEVCRVLANNTLVRIMKAKQYTARTVAQKTGLDFTAISMYARGKRPFSCKLSCLQPLSQLLDLSCNSFLMGVDSDICLPYEESALVDHIMQLSADERDMLCKLAVDKWEQYTKEHPSPNELGLHRPINYLITDRLEILNKAKRLPLSIYFGSSAADNPVFLRTILKKCESHVPVEEFISNSTLMFLAFELEYPIDWLVCEKPLARPNQSGMPSAHQEQTEELLDTPEQSKVTYTDSHGVEQELTDPTVIRMMNAYLALPRKERLDLFTAMCFSVLGQGTGKNAPITSEDMESNADIKNAAIMIRAGIPLDDIARYTHLSLELLTTIQSDLG